MFAPVRNLEKRKDPGRDLNAQPGDDGIGDRDLVDVVPLQLSEEVFQVHL